jgi:hypothetical protein
MTSICRTHASNVKNWCDGTMALRWCAAGMVEVGKQFRQVNGDMHLLSLRDTLNRVNETVGATVMMRPSTPPDDHRAATEVPRTSRHPRPLHRFRYGRSLPIGAAVLASDLGGAVDATDKVLVARAAA